MLKFILILLLGATFTFAAHSQNKSDIQQSSSGFFIVASNGESISINLPKGWVADGVNFKKMGAEMLVYPSDKLLRPETLSPNAPLIRAFAVVKSKNNESVKSLIKNKHAKLATKGDPKLDLEFDVKDKMRKQGDLKITSVRHSSAAIPFFDYTLYLENERVIYVISMFAREKSVREKYVDVFKYITDNSGPSLVSRK